MELKEVTKPETMDIKEIIKPENLVYSKSAVINDDIMHYCPGCSHGVVHKLLAELIEEMGIQEKTVGIAPVGCAVFAYNYIDIDWQEAAHGRAPAVATGVARLNPDNFVFTYQGDGDLASIGTAEIMHACNRGENILVIFINNGIYGMTGGQMAPTTLEGMVTSTTPTGRNIDLNGYPMKITNLIAQLPGTSYVTRQAVHTAASVRKCKRSIKKAIQNVLDKKGTSFVEVVSTCNSGWKMTPVDANKWMEENMIPYYPLGDLKDSEKGEINSENQKN
jgi:2-oxoglutarate ferredoxin oxidoreductase subunit beta